MSRGPTPMQFLEMTPEQYQEFCDKRMELSSLRPDGTVNNSRFLQWAIEKYGLEIDEEYHIRVGRRGVPVANKENTPDNTVPGEREGE